MKNPDHIFWDWNGTLLNDAWLCLDVMNRMLDSRGMPRMTPERYRDIFDFPIVNYYDRIGFDYETERFEDLGREFIDGYEQRRMEASLYADSVRALSRIESMGLGQSILSAYRHDTLVTLVEAHGLKRYFHDVHGHADIYPVGKGEQGQRALDRLGVDPSRTVLIGDTVHDAEVADALGMHCILVPGGNQPEEKLKATGKPMASDRLDALSLIT